MIHNQSETGLTQGLKAGWTAWACMLLKRVCCHLEPFEQVVHLLLAEVVAQVAQLTGESMPPTVLAQHDACRQRQQPMQQSNILLL